MKALIVEDVRSVRNLLSRMAAQAGIDQVITAATGAEAVTLVKQEVPDLVFLDIRLPDMSGLDVLTEIRKLHPQLFVVVATGYEEANTVQEIIRLGANQYIVKPLQYESIEEVVLRCHQQLNRPTPTITSSQLH